MKIFFFTLLSFFIASFSCIAESDGIYDCKDEIMNVQISTFKYKPPMDFERMLGQELLPDGKLFIAAVKSDLVHESGATWDYWIYDIENLKQEKMDWHKGHALYRQISRDRKDFDRKRLSWNEKGSESIRDEENGIWVYSHSEKKNIKQLVSGKHSLSFSFLSISPDKSIIFYQTDIDEFLLDMLLKFELSFFILGTNTRKKRRMALACADGSGKKIFKNKVALGRFSFRQWSYDGSRLISYSREKIYIFDFNNPHGEIIPHSDVYNTEIINRMKKYEEQQLRKGRFPFRPLIVN
jgi:hypothetical protein